MFQLVCNIIFCKGYYTLSTVKVSVETKNLGGSLIPARLTPQCDHQTLPKFHQNDKQESQFQATHQTKSIAVFSQKKLI